METDKNPADNIRRELYILANSPGELSGWVAPVVDEIRTLLPEVTVTVALIPDWFTSGKEREFASKLPVDRIVGIFTLMADVIFKRGSFDPKPNSLQVARMVLFLGGDALYSKALAWMLKSKAMAYMPRVYRPADFIRIFVPDAQEKQRAVRKGATSDQITVVPPLAFDSLKPSGNKGQSQERLGISSSDGPVFSLLAGSRPGGVDIFFGIMIEAGLQLLAEYPTCRVLMPVSPFIDKSIAEKVLAESQLDWHEDVVHGLIAMEPHRRIAFVFGDTHDALVVSDVAMALPGTNNLQCAVLGLPLIVMVPLNRVEFIPFEGLLGLLYPRFFPFNHLKKYLINYLSPRIPYLSLVNKMAGYMLVPEIRGIYTQTTIVEAASAMWRNTEQRQLLSQKLLEFTHERGAAKKIAEAVSEHFLFDERIR